MKLESMAGSVENNIIRLLKKFKEKPAVFLSKSDVSSYLYYLLISDPFLGQSPTVKNLTPTIEQSKTFLIHAGLEVSVESKNNRVALSIGESQKEVELQTWDFLIGIEMEHNVKNLSKTPSLFAEDVEKLAKFKKGYLLWLNWDCAIDDKDLRKVEDLIAKHDNIRLCYLDLFSKPAKTNLKKLV
jgi:hypothetical protein